LQSIGNQHSNRKRFTFHETKISNEVIAPGTVVFQQVEIVPILESSGTCFTRDGGSIYYINLSQDDFKLGGSSFTNTEYYWKSANRLKSCIFKRAFNTIQELILKQYPCRT
jgi:phosphoribosylformylglycinamidine synthase